MVYAVGQNSTCYVRGTNSDHHFFCLVNAEIGFVQLPDITGVKAVQSFSSKHDLEGSEDDEPSEMYVFFSELWSCGVWNEGCQVSAH